MAQLGERFVQALAKNDDAESGEGSRDEGFRASKGCLLSAMSSSR
jgi:hypothetical protein